MGKQQKQTQKTSSRKLPAQHRSRLSCSTPPPHQNLQPLLLHNMQTEEHNNGQRSPPCVPNTVPYFSIFTKAVLGCQKINGINPRSAIRQQQQQQSTFHMSLLSLDIVLVHELMLYVYLDVVLLPEDGSTCFS